MHLDIVRRTAASLVLGWLTAGCADRGPSGSMPEPSTGRASPETPAPVRTGPHPVWAIHGGGLILAPANATWGRGAAQIAAGDSAVEGAFRAVDAAAVPAEHAKLVGTQVDTFDAEGATCRATIVELRVFAPNAHQSDTSAVAARHGVTPPSERATDPELIAAAEALVAEAGGYTWLVGHVELDASCKARGWATPAAAPPPEIVPFEKAPADVAARALAALHALPVFQRIQSYANERWKAPDSARWWAHPEYVEDVTLARTGDGRALVAAHASLCKGYAELTMNLEVYFTLGVDGALTALEPAVPTEARWTANAADLDHDGTLDVITQDGFVLTAGGELQPQVRTRGPVYTCPGDAAAAAGFAAWLARHPP